MRLTHPARRDTTEPAIVDALRAIGVQVWLVSSPGLPDLLTYSRGVWLPIEAKSGDRTLTPAQQETFRRAPFPIVRTVAEALALFGIHDE